MNLLTEDTEMANDINPGNGRDVTLTYTKADGSIGQIQDGVLVLSLSDPTMATASVKTPFDAVTGVAVIAVEHNGVPTVDTDVILTVMADGDLSDAGVFDVMFSDSFTQKVVALGATNVSGVIGDERPTPVSP